MIAETDKGVIVRQGNGRDSVYERNRENLQKNENDNQTQWEAQKGCWTGTEATGEMNKGNNTFENGKGDINKRKSSDLKVAGHVLHGYIWMLYITFTNTNFQVPMTYRFRNLKYLVILTKNVQFQLVKLRFLPKNRILEKSF